MTGLLVPPQLLRGATIILGCCASDLPCQAVCPLTRALQLRWIKAASVTWVSENWH